MEAEVAVFTKDLMSHGSAGGCSDTHQADCCRVRAGPFSHVAVEGGWLCRPGGVKRESIYVGCWQGLVSSAGRCQQQQG